MTYPHFDVTLSLPARRVFICKIKGHPFISRNTDGLTVCSLPVEIHGEGGCSRLILLGAMADRCLFSFRIGGRIKVTGVKKSRPLFGNPDAAMVEIVAWTAEPYGGSHA